MKIKANVRLKATTIIHITVAASEVEKEGGYNISTGANSFRFPDPSTAYTKAADFIKKLIHDGYKYTTRGAMSSKMDVFVKGGTEISVSVHNSILNIDLW